MKSVCRERRNRLVFFLGGGGGDDGGGGLVVSGFSERGIVGVIELAPSDDGGMDVGGAVCTLPPGGVGGVSGIC